MSAAADGSRALTRLTVDTGAIVENYRRLQRVAEGATTAVVVKADAYGMGVAAVAPALADAGAADFFVATLDEAETLRRLTPRARIFLLGGFGGGTPDDCLAYDLVPILNTRGDLKTARDFARARQQRMAVALHVDTGMNRLGLTIAEAEWMAADRDAFAGLDLRLVMSHLACADEKNHPMTAAQIERFSVVRARFPQTKGSLAASSGIFRDTQAHFDMVRPGCALYGVNPTPEAPNPMIAVCRLEARVLQVREIGPRESIGYGASFTAPQAMRTATVAAGYADGVLRSLGNLGYAHAAGFRLPIVGRVSMDLITVDITAAPANAVNIGDWVTLLGPERPVDTVAAEAGTIGYEILTRIAPRALRVVGAL